MTQISELIQALEETKEEYGDVEIKQSHYGDQSPVSTDIHVVEQVDTGELIAWL